jgi:hypothetical protein
MQHGAHSSCVRAVHHGKRATNQPPPIRHSPATLRLLLAKPHPADPTAIARFPPLAYPHSPFRPPIALDQPRRPCQRAIFNYSPRALSLPYSTSDLPTPALPSSLARPLPSIPTHPAINLPMTSTAGGARLGSAGPDSSESGRRRVPDQLVTWSESGGASDHLVRLSESSRVPDNLNLQTVGPRRHAAPPTRGHAPRHGTEYRTASSATAFLLLRRCSASAATAQTPLVRATLPWEPCRWPPARHAEAIPCKRWRRRAALCPSESLDALQAAPFAAPFVLGRALTRVGRALRGADQRPAPRIPGQNERPAPRAPERPGPGHDARARKAVEWRVLPRRRKPAFIFLWK